MTDLPPLAILGAVGCGVLGALLVVRAARWVFRALLIILLLASVVLASSSWWFDLPR